MTTDANSWAPSEATRAATDLPPIGKLFDDTLTQARDHFAGFAMAAVGFAAVQLPLTLFAVVGLYAGMFAGMMPGIQANDEDLMSAGMLAGMGGGLALLIGIFAVVFPPLQASMLRAVWAHLTRGEPLTFGSAFSTVTQDLGRVYGMVLLLGLANLIGLMMCYVPALFVAFVFHFAWPLAIVGRRSPFEAMRESWAHVFANLAWNAKVWGIALLMGIGFAYVPLIGTAAGILFVGGFTLRAARAAFPDLGADDELSAVRS
jgi:uncharacterized membrane protein